MHWCPTCGTPCYCDHDDTDYGTYECERHNELCLEDVYDPEDDYNEALKEGKPREHVGFAEMKNAHKEGN